MRVSVAEPGGFLVDIAVGAVGGIYFNHPDSETEIWCIDALNPS
jgi:hypothetical protein